MITKTTHVFRAGHLAVEHTRYHLSGYACKIEVRNWFLNEKPGHQTQPVAIWWVCVRPGKSPEPRSVARKLEILPEAVDEILSMRNRYADEFAKALRDEDHPGSLTNEDWQVMQRFLKSGDSSV